METQKDSDKDVEIDTEASEEEEIIGVESEETEEDILITTDDGRKKSLFTEETRNCAVLNTGFSSSISWLSWLER